MSIQNRIERLETRRGKPVEPEDLATLPPMERYLAMLKMPPRCRAVSAKSTETATVKMSSAQAYERMLYGKPRR